MTSLPAALPLQIPEPGLALDVVDALRRGERRRRRVAGRARAADLAEIGLEARRGHRPGHLQVARAGVDDLVLEPGRGDERGAGHEGMALAVDLDLTRTLE